MVLSALAGLAALGAVTATPNDAKAQVSIGIGFGATPVQWGGPPPHWGRPGWDRPGWDRPRWHRPPPPYGYGFYRPYRPAYVAPTCWRERRWVDTPWGPEVRHVRICR
ncbi:hypothetical protein [Phreatobacter sp.]|uniref:hypothetical protein n=1 Tax=Phreatobacter sp. TaxID=1966341 RepID=UPI0022BECA27|nr:hypothetical protein [Phreatobacter sp.]MCZ8315234.1 hypothetical protein [Phreatobacter sp.]